MNVGNGATGRKWADAAFIDETSERLLIGYLLGHPDCFGELAVTEEDFNGTRRTIFRAMVRLWKEGRPITLGTLAPLLLPAGLSSAVAADCAQEWLEDGSPLRELRQNLHDRHWRRVVYNHAQVLRDASCDPTCTALDEVVSRTVASLESLMRATAVKGLPYFLDDEAIESLPPDKQLVGQVLAAGELAVLFSKPKKGKSFLALDLALSIASGRPWLGFYPVCRGRVVYILGEGLPGYRKRLRAWKCENGITGNAGVLFKPFLKLRDPQAVQRLLAELRRLPEPPVLVIVDTWARCLGGDENSTEEASEGIAALDRIRAEFGCAVLVFHHSVTNQSLV